ncbi:MAG TPA: DUF6178 family protein [Kofleriaceae bacterium]|nr:DUF6178 family protein [Kofleriaceae bacterium]
MVEVCYRSGVHDAGPLARLRAQLAGPRGARRVDALLSAPDPVAAVASLSVTEIYELVSEVGLDDASELVHLATPEQVRGCLDLEVWDRDHPSMELARPWLASLVDAGFEKLGQVWGGLDPEWRALFIKQHCRRIWDLTLGEEPDDTTDLPMYFTTDRFFTLELSGDEDTVRLVRQLLDDLYRADADLARHTIMAARSESVTELEEESFRWRSGRLADLGYVDYYEALELFRPLEAEAVRAGEGTEDRLGNIVDGDVTSANLPIAVAEHVVARSFLARAWDRLGDDVEEIRLEGALLVVVNKLLAAARTRPGDQASLRAGADYATATISLGLEVVSRGDIDRAAETLRTVALGRLFRAGYTVGAKLARLAHGLAPRAVTAGEPDVSVLGALTQPRPWFARALDEAGRPGLRPFESQSDVRKVAELLGRLTLRFAIAESLGVDLLGMRNVPEPRPELDDHARTAIARAVGGGELSAQALAHDEVRVAKALLERGVFPEKVRTRAQRAILARLDDARIHAAGDQLRDLVEGWLGDVEETLSALEATRIDARYVTGILVETGGARA